MFEAACASKLAHDATFGVIFLFLVLLVFFCGGGGVGVVAGVFCRAVVGAVLSWLAFLLVAGALFGGGFAGVLCRGGGGVFVVFWLVFLVVVILLLLVVVVVALLLVYIVVVVLVVLLLVFVCGDVFVPAVAGVFLW